MWEQSRQTKRLSRYVTMMLIIMIIATYVKSLKIMLSSLLFVWVYVCDVHAAGKIDKSVSRDALHPKKC